MVIKERSPIDNTLNVLLVTEDRAYFSSLRIVLREVLKEYAGTVRLHPVQTIAQAIAYISRAGIYWDERDYPAADILLLDGRESRECNRVLLEWRASSREASKIPFVMLVENRGSALYAEIQKYLDCGANAYLTSGDGSKLFNLLDGLSHFKAFKLARAEIAVGVRA